MYTALMSANEQILVNIQIMKLFGRDTAIYWAELMNVVTKVLKKEKFDKTTGAFELDRDYIKERTTLTLEEQLLCDKALVHIGVMWKDEEKPNTIRLDIKKMFSIITDEDPETLKEIAFAVKTTAKDKTSAKKNAILYTMKALASDPDADVDKLYKDWVESVYANKRYLTKPAVQVFMDTINNFTTDKETKLELLRIAIASGWTDATWVINSYERNHPATKRKQKVATDINTDIKF